MFSAWRHSIRTQTIAFAHDIALIPIAWLGAYWLRYNLEPIPAESLEHALWMLPIVLTIQTLCFWRFGLYRGVWRFASLPDLMRILKAVLVGTLVLVLTLFFLTRLNGTPRSVLPLYTLLLVMGLGGSRFAFRCLKDAKRFTLKGERVLIVGAGRAGESLVRDLLRTKGHGYVPVAFVDDKDHNTGRDIYGVRIVGSSQEIPQIVKRYAVDVILIALPSANAADMRRLMKICERTDRPVRTLPAVGDIVTGRVSLKQLRDVSLDDLLGRDPVSLDWDAIGKTLAGRTILVSGGGGSIGSELCRQIVKHGPKKLVVTDNSEYNLFQLERELSTLIPDNSDIQIICRLVDVCDNPSVEHCLSRYRPDVLFHAAAYKHVPMLESQIREAVNNNILGTHCMAKAALKYGVQKFVLVSSDKAVNPTNIMGATKRAAERLCQSLNRHHLTQFITVRFGNVLGSRGSVVEIFRAQLEAGGPLSVTHPDVTRFFMTIPEASQLILQASALSEGGEIFMLDMGEPVKIRYLAEQMIRLAGKQLGEDIDIEYTGLRPGEKLVEELFHEKEALMPTKHNKILKLRCREETMAWDRRVTFLEGACRRYDERALLEEIGQLVPEFQVTVSPPINLDPQTVLADH